MRSQRTGDAMAFVLPGNVDDVTEPSGGNTYDRRMCDCLPGAGVPVLQVAVPGSWPEPGPAGRARLDQALETLPDGTRVLVDGLVACGVPDVVVPHARRLRLGVLVHLPLADETGLDPAHAAELDALERETLSAVRQVVATSPAAARAIARRHGLPAACVDVVEPGVDPAAPASGTDGVSRLLCVAAVTPRKGQDVLLEALARVPGLTVDFVGSLTRAPEYVDELRWSVQRLGLAGRVTFTGPKTGAALDAAYDRADLVTLPSHAETYGMVVTEALARGIPVVASEVGGVPDALGRAAGGAVPGLLVPPGDTGALAAALSCWAEDAELRRALRAAALGRGAALEEWDGAARRLARVAARWRPVPTKVA